MGHRTASQKVVFTPDPGDRAALKRVVKRTKYPSVSAFVRAAVHEKLARLRDEQMVAAVERFCDAGAEDTDDLVAGQAFDA